MSTIREAIRNRIDSSGQDPAAVAAAAGMTPAQLQRALNGARKISALELVNLCQVLELDLGDLKGREVAPVYDTDNGHDLYRVVDNDGHTIAEFKTEQAARDYFGDAIATADPETDSDFFYPRAVIDPAGRIIEEY